MSNAASNYLEDKLLNHTLQHVGYDSPAVVKLALFTDDAGGDGTAVNLEDGTLTDEVAGGEYARQTILFAAASDGTSATSDTVTFPVASANWGEITHIALMENSTDNMLFWGAVTTPKTIITGDTFQVTAGNLHITLN